ncbi:hypothetical protein GM30_15850 [Trabulsiella odontotermitis]|nr:hypothetical protein GM30_15850 [Trabulsiella odontotermitis]
MMNMDKSFTVFAIGFFEIESAAFTNGTVMRDTGSSGFRISFVGINSDDLSGTLRILLWKGNLIWICMVDNIGIPDIPLLLEPALFKASFKILYDRNVPIFRAGGMNHIEGIEIISLMYILQMLDCLTIAGLPDIFGAKFPFFPQNNSTPLFMLRIPGSKYYHLEIVIYK